MPTKEQIESFMKEDMHNSVLVTARHFGVEPQDVWDILNDKQVKEVTAEVASCENPHSSAYICTVCIRNRPSEFSSTFKIQKKLGNINHTCDGYVNKGKKQLF